MSFENLTIQLRAIIRLRQTFEETFVNFNVIRNITIAELVQYINAQIRIRYNYESTAMYYMFNEFQTDMNEEARLGGVLLPNDCLIEYSMIEPGSTLFIEAEPYVHQAGEEPELVIENVNQELEHLVSAPNPPVNQYQDFIQNQPVVDIDIDNHARMLDVYSLLDMFSRVAGIAQPRPPVNPLLSFNDILQVLQVASVGGNLQRYDNLQDVKLGIDPNDLNKLNSGLYKDLKESNKHKLDMCSICFEQFNDDEECRELKCNHMFHQKCVDTWLAEHVTCPVCREETGKSLPQVYNP
jgi:hypothetical protein